MIVTLIGYLVLIDGMLNSLGWALDLVANHTLINRVLMVGWGNMFDAGYFWHYNEAVGRRRGRAGREGLCGRADPHRLRDARAPRRSASCR